MTLFIKALEDTLNVTATENGAPAYKSTGSKCLDLFGKIAASRNDPNQAVKAFRLAYSEDPETATRTLFWARDIRGGQGERSVFRAILKELALEDSAIAIKLLPLIPEYGRWDDLLVLEDTELWPNVLDLFKKQFEEDKRSLEKEGTVSLLGKWLPSINASSKDSKRRGRKIASHLNLSEKEYRKALTALRERIKIVEQAMCSRDWSTIDYGSVPSKASLMYRKTFAKRDPSRYQSFLDSVKKGEAKINAGTLYPYEIVDKCLYHGERGDTLDALWNALPNYMEGHEFNGLVVADVSGSMMGQPMAVSISLAMYIAERNSGPWNGKFLTFSENPELQTVTGSSLYSKIRNLSQANWGMNTDLQRVFDLILGVAQENNLNDSDMPKRLIIVSDMQFDQCCSLGIQGTGRFGYTANPVTNFDVVREKYSRAGYDLPEIVFWNVRATGNVPIQQHESGACLVSGCSPSILQAIFSVDGLSPMGVLRQAVYANRYNPVGAVFQTEVPNYEEMKIKDMYRAILSCAAENGLNPPVTYEVFRELMLPNLRESDRKPLS